jgi:aspartate aminotransferase
MPAKRIRAITEANAALLSFIEIWDRHRHDADVADFAFGNPQEIAIDGYAAALAAATTPADKHHYEYKRSEDEPRRTVAKHLAAWRGRPFDPEDIALTPGAFGAIAVAMSTVVDPGDEVIISLPPWFFYESMVLSVGAVPVKIHVRASDYDLDLDAIEAAITQRTRLVIVNTPHNPTGRIYPPETLRRLAGILTEASDRHGAPIYLLSDEPYARLVFSDAAFISPSDYYPYTLISYSYGKILLTPGQRIGWLAMTPDMPDREQMRTAIFMAQVAGGWQFPSAVMQYAIDDLEGLSIDLTELERKRDRLGGELAAMGYDLRLPEGTFYLWVRSPESDDMAFVRELGDRKVLVLPGTTCESPGHFRISLTATPAMIERALPVFAEAITEPGRR